MNSPNQPQTTPNGPQMITALKAIKANADVRYELLDHQAAMLRSRYNLLMDKGFSEPQAMFLCTQDWSNAT